MNPNIFEPHYDYLKIKKRTHIYAEELFMKTLHPSRIQKLLDMGVDIDDL